MARTKRIDPPARSADGSLPHDQLVNADHDNFDYKFVNPNDESTGVAMYEALGYDCVIATKGGVRSALGRSAKEGQRVMVLGQVLMQRPKEDGEAEFQRGQSLADAIDRRILKDGNLDRDGVGKNVTVGIDRGVSSEPFHELE